MSDSERGRPAKRRVPWFVPPHIRARRAKAARLKRKGIKPLTKAEVRAMCDLAGRSPAMLSDETKAASDAVRVALKRIRTLN